jgi:hypothetical protein
VPESKVSTKSKKISKVKRNDYP